MVTADMKLKDACPVLRKKNVTGGIKLPDSDYTTKLINQNNIVLGQK